MAHKLKIAYYEDPTEQRIGTRGMSGFDRVTMALFLELKTRLPVADEDQARLMKEEADRLLNCCLDRQKELAEDEIKREYREAVREGLAG